MSAANSPEVFRFAPSPNGELHLGHALSAIVGHDWARATGGRFLVRIEDIDPVRTREEHVRSILDDLSWLGLTWDGEVLRQSSRFQAYASAAGRLRGLGLLYPCFATRGEIAAEVGLAEAAGRLPRLDPDGVPLYPFAPVAPEAPEIADRRSREPHAWRIDMTRALAFLRQRGIGLAYEAVRPGQASGGVIAAADPSAWGDCILVRKDTPASYHLAVVVDDAHQGVTVVTRGKDLEAATAVHRLLQELLGLPVPRYHHHALLLDAGGQKLSKSAGAPSLKQLRLQGASPGDVRRLLAGHWPSRDGGM